MEGKPLIQLYRPNVAAVVKVDGLILGCLRSEFPGWQCVQGGIESTDSSFEAAIVREIHEELGIAKECIKMTSRSKVWRRYRFPPHLVLNSKNDYCGQEQLWFEAEISSLADICLEKSSGEFCEVKLMSHRELADSYVEWKKRVFVDFCHELHAI
jgi:8-oxo-dGTP pyrophosphatase MutT (NUDIX family)